MNRQTLVLKKMKEMVESKGFVFIHNRKWGNTGSCEIMDEDMTCFIRFIYDFQNMWETMKFQFYPGHKEAVSTCGFTHPDCINNVYLKYSDSDGLKSMFNWFNNRL